MFCSDCGSQAEEGARFCATCGRAFEAPQEQPESATTPMPADEEPAEPATTAMPADDEPAAPPTAPMPAAAAALPIGQRAAAPPPPPPSTPALAAASGDASRPRRLGPRLIVAAGLIALVVVIVVLVKGLGGGAGGADTPVGAVQNLAAALRKEDPAAALGTIAPGESRDVSALYAELRKHAGHVLRSDGGLAGAQVSVSALKLESQDLGNGVAKVSATSGRLSAALKDAAGASLLAPRSSSQSALDLGGSRDYLMARKQDGAWFVSPILTLLQQLVDYEGLPQPDFSLLDDEGDSAGAPKTPQVLMSALAQAISDKNVDALLNLFSDREVGVVRAYRAAAQELVSRISGSLDATVSDTDIEQHSLGSGRVRLDIKHASAHAKLSSDYDVADVDLRLNGFCLDVQGTTSFSGCDTETHRILGINDPFVVADTDGGRLRLAPLATIKAYADQLIDHVGDAGVKRILGTVAQDDAGSVLRSGVNVTGKLNEGGYALHAYQGAADELLAIDTDRTALVVGPGGARVPVLGCQDGTALFQLPAAGTYKVIVAGATYAPGPYRIVAERVKAASAGFPSNVSGTVGDRARVAVVRFDKPASDVQFTTDSLVSSTIVDPNDDSYPSYDCAGDSRIGPASVFAQGSEDQPQAPTEGDGGTYSFDTDASGERLLIIAGASDARFSGTLDEYSYGG
jgi:hypothetical protein